MKKESANATAFILGLIGGIFGILSGILVLIFSGWVALSGTVVDDWGGKTFFSVALVAIFSGIGGIIGATYSKTNPRKGGWIMIIVAIIGTIAISWGYVLAGPLLLLGGIVSLIKSKKAKG